MKLKKHHEPILYLIMIFLVGLSLFWRHADADSDMPITMPKPHLEDKEVSIDDPTILYWQLYIESGFSDTKHKAGLFHTWIECENQGQHITFTTTYATHTCEPR